MHGRFIAKIFAALQNLPDGIQLRNSRVIVSLSGGPDSTSLLIAACEIASQIGLEIHACHINHKRRGAESDSDQEFCKQLCERLAVELHVFENVEGTSEESLRDVRRSYLSEQCRLLGSSVVLLAHTSDDQVETVLFRLLRGTSLTGLAGIKSAHQFKNGVWYVRPMLNCDRSEVNEFLSEKGVTARIDSSNAANDYARNFLRNEVIPLAQTRFPSMVRQIERLRETAESEDELLSCVAEQAAERFGGLSSDRWSVPEYELLHISIKRRVLAKALTLRDIAVSYERLQAILNMMALPVQSTRVSLNEKWDVMLDSRFLTWIDKELIRESELLNQDAEPAATYIKVNLAGYTFLLASGAVLSVESANEVLTENFRSRESLEVLVDLSRISGALVVRSVTPHDKIQPLGMHELVGIKKYFHSNNKRRRLLGNLVLADDREILWVPGVGLSERIKVIDQSTHKLKVSEIAPDAQFA